MFTPIKNFITYIQRNASVNSIFGGNSTSEDLVKMEIENTIVQHESEKFLEMVEKDKKESTADEHQNSVEEPKGSAVEEQEESATKPTTIIRTTSIISTENSCEFENDHEDIEAQIESCIMLKQSVNMSDTNGADILKVTKSTSAGCSIVISHDYNRNQTLTPIDDELEDFRHDPTEILGSASSSLYPNVHTEEFYSVESVGEAEDFPTEEEEKEEDNESENVRKKGDAIEMALEEEYDKEIEAETEQKNADIDYEEEDEDEEELFLDLDNYERDNVIVIEEVDLNGSTTSIDTNNTADDPLAIACEEQEAFAADKAAALEELNLLNTSHNSQDEDTRTTTEDDLQWLKSNVDDPQPSCNEVLLKNNDSEVTQEKEERNGEGSDSGLGSETSALHITTTSVTDTSQLNTTTTIPAQRSLQTKTKDSDKLLVSNLLHLTKSPMKDSPKPYRSNLKRRLEVDDVDDLGPLTSTISSHGDHSSLGGSIQKKPKRSINFDTVQVYYFPRQQGFSCVPSAGGCTLGMGSRHVAFKTLTLAEHAAELRRAHRMQLQEINPRGSSSDDSEESEEDYLSEGSGSDLDGESNGFLQPVSPKQRRALLKAAGIRKIDPSEKADCRNIRNSREVCGCTCRDFCDPETCSCSQSGIKCQVDRDMFPCGCSRDACGNTIGRVEFNPARVRTHFIHTLMRLEMENRQQQNPYSSAVASPLPMQPTPSSYYQSHLQPQSNYSSGYASPAYNTASELHQQVASNSYYHSPTPTANSLYGQQTSLEIAHTGSICTTTSTSQHGIDSLDTNLFGGNTTATPSYGELLPVASYHYGSVHTQASLYNSYHNSPYINENSTTTSISTTNAYSSCAVPSIPPYGTATTTEASGVYHSVSSLTNLETTTAPSCSVSGTTSLENDASASFISLSTPIASSSRLSQINDLLQHNRNATTALVAVTENLGITNSNSASASTSQANSSNILTTTSSINTPPIENAHKTCMIYEELTPHLKPAPIVAVTETGGGTDILTTSSLPAAETLKKIEESPLNIDYLPQTSLCKDDKEATLLTVGATIESSAIEVAVGK